MKPITWLKPPTDSDEPLRIKTASISRVHKFETCPRMAALAFITKVPEPERQGESPLDRGSRHHEYIEQYIRGETDELSPEIKHFRDDPIEPLRVRWRERPDTILVEQRWNFDDAWQPCGDKEWDKIWLIMKLDVMGFISDDGGVAIDWKTGKKFGNEVKHGDQLLAYIVGAFMRYPSLETMAGELFYTDKNESTTLDLTRENAMRYMPRLNSRLQGMTNSTTFVPKPSKSACRFCPYKTGNIVKGVQGTGHCDLNPE